MTGDQDEPELADGPGVDAESPASGRPDLERIGRYRLLRQIGWGGMGIVYEAIDTAVEAEAAAEPRAASERSSRRRPGARGAEPQAGQDSDRRESPAGGVSPSPGRVALKLLRFTDPSGNALRRFQQEGAAALRLQHPGIVAVHEVARADGYDYYTMDYVIGQEFDTWLASGDRSLRRIIEIFRQVAVALDHAHTRGVLHRDLKPANILVDFEGQARVADFGLARTIGADSSITGSGQTVGTPAYMSPEQAEGQHKDCGPPSDVWSIGVMLYEALTGVQPFTGDSALDVLHAVVTKDPPSPSRVRQDLPRRLDRIVMQCLAKHPRDRYATAGELAEDLERYLQGSSVRARSQSGWRSFRRWRRRLSSARLLAGTFAAIAAIAVVIVIGRSWAPAPDAPLPVATDPVDPIEWVPVFAWSAADGPLPETGLERRNWTNEAISADWSITEAGLRLPSSDWFMLTDLGASRNIRLSCTVSFTAGVDGLELLLNGHDQTVVGHATSPIGYSAQAGGYQGLIDFISPNHRPQTVQQTGAVRSLVAGPGPHRITFERRGDRLTLHVDGEVSTSFVDPLPLPSFEGRRIAGLRTWTTGVILHDISLERGIGAEQHPALAAIDTLIAGGQRSAAARECQDLIAVVDDPEITAPAHLKLAAIAFADEMIEADIGHRSVAELKSAHPRRPETTLAEELAIVWLWGRDRYPEALDRLDDLLTRMPTTTAVRRLLLAHAGRWPEDPDRLHRAVRLFVRDPQLAALNLEATGITDLSTLSHARILSLNLENNDLDDISALASLRLGMLSLADNRIASLAALGEHPLRILNVRNNLITDLRPLAGKDFDALVLNNNPLGSLAGLERCTVRELDVRSTTISDLEPLRGQDFEELDLSGNPLADLEPLSGSRITTLDLAKTRITDPAPILRPGLEELDLGDTPLATVPDLTRTPDLARLSLQDTDIADLGSLTRHPCTQLALSGTRLTSLGGLATARLRVLNCSGSAIGDLGPVLAAPGLSYLEWVDAPVDAEQLLALDDAVRVKIAATTEHPFTIATIDRLIAGWDGVPARAELVRGLRSLRAIVTGDHAALVAQARHHAGLLVLEPLLHLDYAEAQDLADRLGWRLPTAAEAVRLIPLVDDGASRWLAPAPDGPPAFLRLAGALTLQEGIPETRQRTIMLVRDAPP